MKLAYSTAPASIDRMPNLTAAPVFRTPEQVAPELGMRPTELRRYVRESGICTRLSKNRIMLHEDDIRRLVEWVRSRNYKGGQWWVEQGRDPFA